MSLLPNTANKGHWSFLTTTTMPSDLVLSHVIVTTPTTRTSTCPSPTSTPFYNSDYIEMPSYSREGPRYFFSHDQRPESQPIQHSSNTTQRRNSSPCPHPNQPGPERRRVSLYCNDCGNRFWHPRP
ncbi:hypothetical protein BDZ89DRAFT_429846 [Hymenopellis radicata]|nr:hypothetical protein BDZ89DRAFT_429846 [Hymenopellis radicata]